MHLFGIASQISGNEPFECGFDHIVGPEESEMQLFLSCPSPQKVQEASHFSKWTLFKVDRGRNVQHYGSAKYKLLKRCPHTLRGSHLSKCALRIEPRVQHSIVLVCNIVLQFRS